MNIVSLNDLTDPAEREQIIKESQDKFNEEIDQSEQKPLIDGNDWVDEANW